ncbi:MAG: flagellar biosynthesis protein FlhF [candidate division FCPU426 bacterium]
MRILRFEAPTVHEALQRVRLELGPEAVVLYTKKVRRGGLFGLMGHWVAEITAGLDDAPGSFQHSPPRRSEPESAGERGSQPEESRESAPVAVAEASPVWSRRQAVFQSELNDGKVLSGFSMLRQPPQKKAGDLHPEMERLRKDLDSKGVDPEIAERLLTAVGLEFPDKNSLKPGDLDAAMKTAIASLLKVSGPIKTSPGTAKVIAFIGPTGVGKTTNLVKLASQYALINRLKVAMLTADTYRIGAVEQLKIYRDIIDIPFEPVATAGELREAIRRHSDCDLIFFDTAGRSPQNKTQLQELRAILEAAAPAEVHLVISATTKHADLLPIVGKFSLVPINRFLLTKLDETRTHGMVLNLAANFSIPISYLSVGQNVPNDIEEATPGRLAEWVMGDPRG